MSAPSYMPLIWFSEEGARGTFPASWMPGLICVTNKVLPRVWSDIPTLEVSRRVFIFSALVGWTLLCFARRLRSHASSLTLSMQQLLIPRRKLSSRVPLMHLFHESQLSGMACCESRAFLTSSIRHFLRHVLASSRLPVGRSARFRLRNFSACLTLLWQWTMC